MLLTEIPIGSWARRSAWNNKRLMVFRESSDTYYYGNDFIRLQKLQAYNTNYIASDYVVIKEPGGL